jgi:hypothetical protein
MLFKYNKVYYKRNLELSLIISLSILIFAFYFFPKIKFSKEKIIEENVHLITVNDIPQTIQNKIIRRANTIKPALPSIIIPDNLINIEILEDVKVNKNIDLINSLISKDNNGESAGLNQNNFVPKQILEVVPDKSDDNFQGVIYLSLKIGKDGMVITHKVLRNTTNSRECLQKVIAAAYSSKWEPMMIGGKKKEYWVEKSYQFNN